MAYYYFVYNFLLSLCVIALMMKKRIILIISVGFVLLSCGTFTFNDTKGARVIASLGSEKLYLRDVVGLNSPDLTEKDSADIIYGYAEYWLKTRAVAKYSQDRYSSRSKEIDKLVDEYKSSLFLEFFEKEYTRGVSDYISESEIDKYYNDNQQKYVLSSNMVKAQLMTIPNGYKDSKLIKNKFASNRRDDFEDIVSIAERDNLIVKDFSQAWVYLNDLATLVPLKNEINKLNKSSGVYEVSDDNFQYLVKIIDYKQAGNVTPKELVVDLIRRAIIIDRRKSKVQQIRDSIYTDAVTSGEAVIK